ncbi:MAG TPA: PGPGW domain-containing protein [Nonomuraea sp.]|nr:PGPGW domain-containing protein [Nonomuraea sp.]HEX4902794.1 PGPGW domain-containing protein [Acidimicrobiales bacterium]
MTDPATELTARDPEERVRGRLHRRLHSHPVLALTTKVVVTLVGSLVLLAGVVMIFTPGQGILAIVLGLAILATEYAWAERWLRKAKDKASEARRRAEQMDPKVRRRRLLVAGLAVLLAFGAGVVYVVAFDWPVLVVDGWDWVQSLAGWVPDLPGM